MIGWPSSCICKRKRTENQDDDRRSLMCRENIKSTIVSIVLFVGAADEARTRYLHLGKVALYQMSYSRMSYFFCLR